MTRTAYCSCNPKRMSGFHNGGSMWVCASCGCPTHAYLKSKLSRMAEAISTNLHLFRNGPRHNEVWSTEELLTKTSDEHVAAWIAGYDWTEETVTGSETGRTARVWVWRT